MFKVKLLGSAVLAMLLGAGLTRITFGMISGASKNAITLVAGTGTATVTSGARCVCTDSTANASVKCAVVTTTLTATGTGADVISYICF